MLGEPVASVVMTNMFDFSSEFPLAHSGFCSGFGKKIFFVFGKLVKFPLFFFMHSTFVVELIFKLRKNGLYFSPFSTSVKKLIRLISI